MYRRLTCRPHSSLQRLSAVSRRQRFSTTDAPSNDITQQLQQKVYDDFKKLNIAKNAVILLGVSGGCDSVAMLHLLQNIREKHEPELDLKVVNYNHKTRPETDTEVSARRIWGSQNNHIRDHASCVPSGYICRKSRTAIQLGILSTCMA